MIPETNYRPNSIIVKPEHSSGSGIGAKKLWGVPLKEQREGESEVVDGFTRRKEQSKEDIRRAAWELFGQFGVEKVTVADIASKAGVSQATIYNNFGSKDTLAREFVTAMVDQLVQRVEKVISPDKPYREKMLAFIQFLSEILGHGRPSEIDATVFTSSSDLRNDPLIKSIRDSAQDQVADLLLGLVREGKEQGQISPDLSEEAFRIYFLAFMDIFTDPQLQHRFDSDPKLARDLGSLMMCGLYDPLAGLG
jgi:AcrR family transcriptional regulator